MGLLSSTGSLSKWPHDPNGLSTSVQDADGCKLSIVAVPIMSGKPEEALRHYELYEGVLGGNFGIHSVLLHGRTTRRCTSE